ncbi:MAG: RNA polymerase recycling motor HelD [Eubacteriales bacterium]
MITNKETWKYEKEYLENVISEIKKQINNGINAVKNYKKEAVDLQKEMWDEVRCAPTDLFDLEDATQIWQYQSEISIRSKKYKFLHDKVNRLKKIYQKPYFGRIDFIEDGERNAEQIYIGIHNLMLSDTLEFLIYDWRAPISSMFYDFEIGPSNYECPDGVINGEMLLKRQYSIENFKIVYMFDSSLSINDEILQEILGKSIDNRMSTIVTSIQREQNTVIRNVQDKVLVVEGPAGSGKTSIALHRAAYLLYKYRESIKSEDILVFSPNHVFEDYISTVLPDLGEENILKSTFFDFFINMLDKEYQIETFNQQMEYILSNYCDEIRLDSIKFKSSLQFLSILKKYVQYINNEVSNEFHDLIYNGSLVISADNIIELFNNSYNDLPYIKRLERLRQRLFYLLEQREEKRAMESENHDKNESLTDQVKILAEQKSKIEYENLQNEIIQMTTYNIYFLYKNLFKNIESFSRTTENQEFGNLHRFDIYTTNQLEQRIINYEDVAPIIFLKTALDGANDKKSIKHIIIDEAQDYTVIQYEVFKNIFQNSNMTILGDINQSINGFMNIGDFDIITDVFKKSAKSVSLTKSYRSSKEIADFCKAMLMSPIGSEQLNRHGNKPKIIKIDESNLYKRIVDDIIELKSKSYKRIAVICKTARQCESIYESLNSYVDISLISNQNDTLQGDVVVIPSYLAKGLEFDAVLLNFIDDKDYFKQEDRRLLYTVCTRALHELYLYYSDNMSSLVSNIGEDLYQMIQT